MQGPPQNESVQAARELLGVTADVDRAQLVRAYRRQARRFHPDVSREPDATERFWALQAAYHLALATAARDTAQTSAGAATPAPTPPKPTHVQRSAPPVVPVVIGPTTVTASAALTAGNHPVRDRAWLVAGPVHVRPALGHTPSTAPTSPSWSDETA
jgi:hypothetical protein